MHYKNIGSLKEVRKLKKITQKEVSLFIGISERTYRSKENGLSPFNQYEMIKLKKFFNLDYEDVVNMFFSTRYR